MKSKALSLFLIVILSMSVPAGACINDKNAAQQAEEMAALDAADLKPRLVTPTNKTALNALSPYISAEARRRPTLDNLNSLAVVLIRYGRLAEAADLLLFLERSSPGQYAIASNLGTVYELMGQNEDALTWIAEGIKRNPASHQGTEWLHVHILKAKLGRLPAPVPGRSILNLDFGNQGAPRAPTHWPLGNAGRSLTAADALHALKYQVLERVQFIAAPNATMAGLLLDWANLALLEGSTKSANVLYDAALRYGSTQGATIKIRKTYLQKREAQSRAIQDCVTAFEREKAPVNDPCFRNGHFSGS